MAGMNRRDFFKMVGVTGAASVAGCDARVPAENVIPYMVQPEEITPGIPTLYASICGECAVGCGVLAKTREGRVILHEPNPDSPVGGSGLCAGGVTSVQETYNPDRLQGPVDGGETTDWGAVLGKVGAAVKGAGAGGVRWLGRYRTGALSQLIGDFVGQSKGSAVHWEPLGYASLSAATKLAFGADILPRYAFDDAHTIVTFGAEFLHTWLNPAGHAESFKNARDPFRGDYIAKFYAVSSRLGNSSARADTFWSVKPGSEADVARALAKLVAEKKGRKDIASSAFLKGADASAAGVDAAKLEALADELAAKPSVVFPGGADAAGANATDLALATLVLNDVCGNIGKTVMLGSGQNFGPVHSFTDVEKLLADCAAGKVKVLFLDGLDPAFSLPADANVADALAKVGTLVVLANSAPEGVPESAIILPPGSSSEAWGDSASHKGAYGLQQPAMQPLYDTRSVGDVLLAVAAAASLQDPTPAEEDEEEGKGGKGKAGKGGKGKAGKAGRRRGAIGADKDEDEEAPPPPQLGGQPAIASFAAADFQRYVAGRWHSKLFTGSGDFGKWWRECLQRGGFFPGVPETTPKLRANKLAAAGATQSISGDYALILFPHSLLYDGRHAHKSWAQEVPEPISGYTWNTWAEISTATAAKLGVDDKGSLRISSDQGALELGVFINPAARDDVVGVVMGNGHKAGNRFSKDRGFNPVSLIKKGVDARSGDFAWLGTSVTLAKGASENPMEQLKGSEDMDHRPIALESYVDDVLEHPTGEMSALAAIHRIPEDARLVEKGIHDMYPEPEHPTYRFALSVNLDNCTGCGVCEIACIAENNIAITGPFQHQMHRYMSWIRLSRFFVGEGENPDMRFIPMMCQHCAHAPCEGVCPVVATYHNLDGLNAMIYNRCVGTRYCANNCPYSARRFNYHTFRWPGAYTLQLNPAVSTREMGVMEKCSFCIQRIRDAKDEFRGETVPDEVLEHLPACAQACPTDAFTFGNRKDEKSKVAIESASPRSYIVLSDLNTKPGVQYMTKINFHRTGGGHGDSHGDPEGHGDADAPSGGDHH